MPIAISVKTVIDDLQGMLAQLPWGETMTLVDEGGEPLALLVSLKTKPMGQVEPGADWEARWDAEMLACGPAVPPTITPQAWLDSQTDDL